MAIATIVHKSQRQIQESLSKRQKMWSKTRQVLESRLADDLKERVCYHSDVDCRKDGEMIAANVETFRVPDGIPADADSGNLFTI